MTDRQMTNLQTDSSSQTDRQPVFVIDQSEFEPSCHQRRSRWSLKPCISYYPSSYISCVQLPFQLLSSSVLILSCIIARNRRSNYHLRLGQPFATACTRALLATPRTCIQKLFCKTSFFSRGCWGASRFWLLHLCFGYSASAAWLDTGQTNKEGFYRNQISRSDPWLLRKQQLCYISPQGAAVFSYFEPPQIRVLSPAIKFLKTLSRSHIAMWSPCQKHRECHLCNSSTIIPDDLRMLKPKPASPNHL